MENSGFKVIDTVRENYIPGSNDLIRIKEDLIQKNIKTGGYNLPVFILAYMSCKISSIS